MNDITLDSCDEISLEVLNKYIIVKYEISTHTYTHTHRHTQQTQLQLVYMQDNHRNFTMTKMYFTTK